MKKGTYLIIFLIIFYSNNQCFSQDFQWAKRIGGPINEVSFNLALDGLGNVYISGYFSGTSDFDPSSTTANLMSHGYDDIFFAKYDNNGNYLWAKSIGSTSVDYGYHIVCDKIGNIYITGAFSGTADFDPGTGIANLTAIGYSDIFFAKYDNNGNYLWAKSIGSINIDYSYSLALDKFGNIYITGEFRDTVDFDTNSGVANLFPVGMADIFFAKYDSFGNYIWAKSIGSIDNDKSFDITVDDSSNVYITGSFRDTADFDTGLDTSNLISSGSFDIFFAKYDVNGNYLWAKSLGCTSWDESYCITIDSLENIYITGEFRGQIDFNPNIGVAILTSVGLADIFFAKYDKNGNYLWANNIGGSDDDEGRSIAVDGIGNVYITGRFQNIADFDNGPDTTNIVAVGNEDIFIAKYDSDGNYIWAKNIGSFDVDCGNSIAIDSLNNVYITGVFKATADFNPSIETANLIPYGLLDIFIAKYGQTTGIEETESNETEDLIIYPNPTHDKISIFIFSEISKETYVSILDIHGKQIMYNKFQNQKYFEFDVSTLTNGFYLVRIQTEKGLSTKKLIIQ